VLRHRWDVSPDKAIALQRTLCRQVRARSLPHPPRSIGGLDVHGLRGAVAVFSYPDLKWIAGETATRSAAYPYVPGLLSFREVPVLLATLNKLEDLPDVLLCDGHGLAHPRRFGLACHLGVWLERPTIGCAKTRLCGVHNAVPTTKGRMAPLLDGGTQIGAVLRTRSQVKPVYVSIGNLITLQDAVEVVLRCSPRYRVPEPLRAAHHMAKSGKRPSAARGDI
jgi:deoxyribonuclease V